jgi:hypothetical protein
MVVVVDQVLEQFVGEVVEIVEGGALDDVLIERAPEAMGRANKAAKARAIAFGFQVVLGTLVNAILNDPGPLSCCCRRR